MALDLNKFYNLGTLTKAQVDENWDDIIAFTKKASAESIRAGTSREVVTVWPMYQANVAVASSGAGVWHPKFRDGIVFIRNMTGNSTLSDPDGGIMGKAGLLYFIQDATGGRTLSFSSVYKHIGGPPNISLAPNAVNLFSYYMRSWDDVNGWTIDLNYLGVVE